MVQLHPRSLDVRTMNEDGTILSTESSQFAEFTDTWKAAGYGWPDRTANAALLHADKGSNPLPSALTLVSSGSALEGKKRRTAASAVRRTMQLNRG